MKGQSANWIVCKLWPTMNGAILLKTHSIRHEWNGSWPTTIDSSVAVQDAVKRRQRICTWLCNVHNIPGTLRRQGSGDPGILLRNCGTLLRVIYQRPISAFWSIQRLDWRRSCGRDHNHDLILWTERWHQPPSPDNLTTVFESAGIHSCSLNE